MLNFTINNKLFLLVGGCGGFLVGFGGGLSANNAAGTALLNGAIGSIAGALIIHVFILVLQVTLSSAAKQNNKDFQDEVDKESDQPPSEGTGPHSTTSKANNN